MTSDEVARLLAVIRARYPTSKVWEQDGAMTLQAWHRTLADCPYQETQLALDEWMRVEKWAPDPAELRDAVAKRVLDLPDGTEAWRMVQSAIAAYYPGFDNSGIVLPAAVRKAVNAIGGLHGLKLSEHREHDRDAFVAAYATERRRVVMSAVLDRTPIVGPAVPVLEV